MRLVNAHMPSRRNALSPAMRNKSLARLETTPVIENAPIRRPQPARMPTSSTKVRPFTSKNLLIDCNVQRVSFRSEERRVGKECSSKWRRERLKKKEKELIESVT